MKAMPKKITHTFCPNCGKYVKFIIDWEGVVQTTVHIVDALCWR